MKSSRLELHGHVFAERIQLNFDYRLENAMPNDACLIYVQHGHQKVYSTDATIVLSTKDAVLLKCGNYVSDLEMVDQNFEAVVFHFHPESVKKIFNGKPSSFFKASRQEFSHRVASKVNRNLFLDNYVASLNMYFENPDLINEALLEVKLQELVLLLADTGNDVIDHLLSTMYIKADVQFEQQIEQNLYNKLSVKELSFLTNRSESTFKRDFKKSYGTSPAKYFRVKKLERGSELLKNTQEPISSIAYDCGFETPAHFTKCFHDEYGVAPSQYRLT